MISLCNDWEFTPEWYNGFAMGVGQGTPVRLPHTVQELPLQFATTQVRQSKPLQQGREWRGPQTWWQQERAKAYREELSHRLSAGSPPLPDSAPQQMMQSASEQTFAQDVLKAAVQAVLQVELQAGMQVGLQAEKPGRRLVQGLG